MPVNDDQLWLIDTQGDLDALCPVLTAADWIGCDTEFVRTQTYWPELCLVQVATETKTACVDVLAKIDTSDFRQIIRDHASPVIFHAVKQDLEAWYATWQELPTAIFDIQIAAGFLGFQPQIGYGNLVKELLGVTLDKDQTRTDWSQRPLTKAQLHYATDDAAYLHQINDIVRRRLEDCGRYEWVLADCKALVSPGLYDIAPEDAWQRLSSVPYLPIKIQARARALTAWRETRAKQADRPRQWILADKTLIQIAHANPAKINDLHDIAELPAGIVRKQGEQILNTVQCANDELANEQFDLVQKPTPVPPDKKQLQQLAEIVRKTARELDIAPEILATRRDLTGILNNEPDSRPLQGWRRTIIGDKLLDSC
ncbi:MAG: ribonuclease D [Gammaproteobacteria bacterium]|jgi:ribonuclease D|nr:ribonuclease D [Gammaproteobacteria bacterium]